MFGSGFINAKPIISMNNFYNPQNKSITYNSDSFTQSNIDLRNNYWGGMTSTELDDVFFDANDTPDKAHIFLFEPMSNSVNDTTGISNSADSTDSTNSTNSTDSGYSSNPENIITCSSLDGAYVYSREEPPVYLGFFGNQFALDSILNKFGTYGSSYNLTSVRNTYGTYGSPYSIYSVANNYTVTPPVIYKSGTPIANLTTNQSLASAVSLENIDASCAFTASSPAF
jgi:hypothetical protein